MKQFLNVLNSQHPNAKFTVESMDDDKFLPFLDVEVKLVDDGVETWVHRKPTDTEVILNYSSLAPMSWKIGLAKCFVNRAKKICSNTNYLRKEICYLGKLFENNDYPVGFVEKTLNKTTSRNQPDNETDAEEPIILKVPYIGTESEKFGKLITKILERRFTIKVKAVYQNFKIGKYFGLKDRTPWLYSTNVVYKFVCSGDGDISYIGMTTRQLFVRVAEHFNPAKRSAVQDHVANCRSCQMLKNPADGFTLCRVCGDKRETEVIEAMCIQSSRPALNKQLGKYSGCSFLLNVFK